MKISRLLLSVFLFSASLFFFLKTSADPDLWGHLKFGQDIYESGKIPYTNIYSYSSPEVRCINHEWLSELIFYLIFKDFGSAGLVIFKFLIGLAIALLIYRSIKSATQSVFLRLFFIIVPLSAIAFGFHMRTQIFTYLLFPIVLIIIRKSEESSDDNPMLFMPIIFLFWCNLHGGFVAALAVVLLYYLYRLFNRSVTVALSLSLILSMAVTLINPYGMDLWRFLLRSLFVTPLSFLTEWKPVLFSFGSASYFIMVFIALFVCLIPKHRPRIYEIILMLAGICYSFNHCRHTVLFAILFAIYMPKYIARSFGDSFLRLEKSLSKNFFNILGVILVALFLLGTFNTNPFRIRVYLKDYPVDAVEFMRANEIEGNILPWFDWAQLCIRELGIRSKVFFDGRYGIAYSDDFIKKYFALINYEIDYRDYLLRFPETDIMFLSITNPLTLFLYRDKEWVAVYVSPEAVIFLKRNLKNHPVIEKHKSGKLIYPGIIEPYYFK